MAGVGLSFTGKGAERRARSSIVEDAMLLDRWHRGVPTNKAWHERLLLTCWYYFRPVDHPENSRNAQAKEINYGWFVGTPLCQRITSSNQVAVSAGLLLWPR